MQTVFNPQGMRDIFDTVMAGGTNFVGQESQGVLDISTPGTPIALAVGYVTFVHGGQWVMKNVVGKPLNLKPLVTLWNLILAVFSVWGAIVTIPYSIGLLLDTSRPVGGGVAGLMDQLCTPNVDLYHGPPGYWAFVFCMSKTPEFVDTVLLVLQQKPVILLHWYHHFTVMLYTWLVWTEQNGQGIYFAAMNFGVHGIMYSYYFLMCFKTGRSLVKPIAPLITSLQIVQMVGGIVICGLSFMALYTKGGPNMDQCPGLNTRNLQLGMGMYISYFVLFSMLFKKMYLGGGKKKKNVDASPAVIPPTFRRVSSKKN